MVTVGADAAGQQTVDAAERAATADRRQDVECLRAARDEPEASATAHRHTRDHRGHSLSDVALQALLAAEGHRGRQVKSDPRRERPLRNVLAHVRNAGAGACRRVDLPHVVAHLVWPQLCQLGADADADAAVFTRQPSACAANECQIQSRDRRGRHRTRALAPGRDDERFAHATSLRIAGASTASITRSRIASAVTPSACAS